MDGLRKWYCVALGVLVMIGIVGADTDPWANFVSSNINGTAPYTVTFVSISNNATAWNWSFRNVAGNNTEIWFNQTQYPTITFNYGGIYAIRLNSSNADGYNITPQLVYVTVNAGLPVAAFCMKGGQG